MPVPAGQARIDVLLPGTLALAVIAAGLVNLGIATAYERAYGVLKRLGGSPLGRTGLIAAKVATILVVEVIVVLVLHGDRRGRLRLAAGAGRLVAAVRASRSLLGTAAFAGLGLALAGTLRAEATLTLANALFIACLLLGGVVVPLDHLPALARDHRRAAARRAPSSTRSGSPRRGRRRRDGRSWSSRPGRSGRSPSPSGRFRWE